MNRALNIAGLLACALGAILAALITTLLTPLYWGSTLVPVAIVAALVANIVFPVLVRWLGLSALASALPFGLWLLTVLVLASSRPEGDVLLPAGKASQQLVTYGMLLAGALAGGITLARLMVTSTPQQETARPAKPGAKATTNAMSARAKSPAAATRPATKSRRGDPDAPRAQRAGGDGDPLRRD